MVKHRKVGFIGAGHMAQAMIQALVQSKTLEGNHIWATNRSPGKLLRVAEMFGIQQMNTNEELIDQCDIVILAVKPQDLTGVLEPIASSFHEGHLVLSLAAGFSLNSLRKLIPAVKGLARVMPNTPATIQRGVVGYSLAKGSEAYEATVRELLQPLGYVVSLTEGDPFEALTVSCGSGTGFVLELMQYWQEWIEEHGIEPDVARKMAVETFAGASLLAANSEETSLEELQDKVVSKKGVTAAGLLSMRELEIERALRYSFEKAVIREQEIARTSAKT